MNKQQPTPNFGTSPLNPLNIKLSNLNVFSLVPGNMSNFAIGITGGMYSLSVYKCRVGIALCVRV